MALDQASSDARLTRREFLKRSSAAGAAALHLAIARPSEAPSDRLFNNLARDSATKYGNIQVSQAADKLVVDTGPMQFSFFWTTGLTSYAWDGIDRIPNAYCGARTDTLLKSTDYAKHRFLSSDVRPLLDGFGKGIQLGLLHTAEVGKPALRQTYYFYEGKRYLLLEVHVESTAEIQTNWVAPLQWEGFKGLDIGSAFDPRVLIVPWDNDHFIRFRGAPINGTGSSYEVTAIYDNRSRKGLVVGSVSHDIWKTGIDYRGLNGKINALTVYGGASSPVTQDSLPHGMVHGTKVVSPRIFMGYYDDWRNGMEEYGGANQIMSPRLPWVGGMPVGWNSWYAYRCNIKSETMISVSDFIRNDLESRGYGNGGVVYANWDSACGAGPKPDYEGVANHIRRNGQRPGIYFVPFAHFGNAMNDHEPVPGTEPQYSWSDLFLRDPNNVPLATDGGRALDPTHPGTQQYVESTLKQFKQWGYEFVKLDFLSHGAMEGRRFLGGMTAIKAYNHGMRYIREAIAGKMFVSLSIAPLFPGAEYGHSRRISCDASGSIHDTEYMLNSVTYGWWLGNYYRYNDGDLVVVGPNSLNAARSRVIASAITGMFLDSDPLAADSNARERAVELLTRPAILALARRGKTFRPVENNTGDRATDTFVSEEGPGCYLAVFNYQQEPATKAIDLKRAGLKPGARYRATDLWNGTSSIAVGRMSVELEAAQAALFALRGI